LLLQENIYHFEAMESYTYMYVSLNTGRQLCYCLGPTTSIASTHDASCVCYLATSNSSFKFISTVFISMWHPRLSVI